MTQKIKDNLLVAVVRWCHCAKTTLVTTFRKRGFVCADQLRSLKHASPLAKQISYPFDLSWLGNGIIPNIRKKKNNKERKKSYTHVSPQDLNRMFESYKTEPVPSVRLKGKVRSNWPREHNEDGNELLPPKTNSSQALFVLRCDWNVNHDSSGPKWKRAFWFSF